MIIDNIITKKKKLIYLIKMGFFLKFRYSSHISVKTSNRWGKHSDDSTTVGHSSIPAYIRSLETE